MSVQREEKNQNHYTDLSEFSNVDKKVNLNDLMNRMQESKKQEKK